MNLCTFGLHKWPRWTNKHRWLTIMVGDSVHDDTAALQERLDGPHYYQVRICKRCKKRQEK